MLKNRAREKYGRSEQNPYMDCLAEMRLVLLMPKTRGRGLKRAFKITQLCDESSCIFPSGPLSHHLHRGPPVQCWHRHVAARIVLRGTRMVPVLIICTSKRGVGPPSVDTDHDSGGDPTRNESP